MRPLPQHQLHQFSERFDKFINAELESIQILSPTEINITMKLQDRARAFDWIELTLAFSGVSDAHIPQENHLSFVDTSSGASLFFSERMFAFGTTECYNIAGVKTSSLYIIAKDLKYEENQF